MTAIEDEILSEFYVRLADIEDVTPTMLGALQKLLASHVKLKPEEVVRIFTPPSEEQIP